MRSSCSAMRAETATKKEKTRRHPSQHDESPQEVDDARQGLHKIHEEGEARRGGGAGPFPPAPNPTLGAEEGILDEAIQTEVVDKVVGGPRDVEGWQNCGELLVGVDRMQRRQGAEGGGQGAQGAARGEGVVRGALPEGPLSRRHSLGGHPHRRCGRGCRRPLDVDG